MVNHIKAVDVAIIGGGFAGLGVGIALQNKGINDFTIFEGEEGLGGSWRTNTYPGCACDVPSHLYSYSFEPNPYWPEAFSKQADIKKYIEHCAEKYDLLSKIKFKTKVTDATFDEKKGVWIVKTDDGVVTLARILVPATGALSHPKYPDIEGREEFKGVAVHAARWDHDIELKGKRVGVIGTGACAIQVVPGVAPEVGELSVFQRTPSWVVPKMNRTYSEKDHKRWRKHPWIQRAQRLGLYWGMEATLPALLWYPKLLTVGEQFHKLNLRRAIKDPALREKLTPNYKVGCKRVLVSDDYFPTFARDNVHLITDGIKEITSNGIKTVDGKKHDLDVIIYASGYEIGASAYPYQIRGLDGVTLEDYWGSQRKAYFGMNVSHFPNMLMTMGPNSGPGHTSVLIYQEAQYKYIAKYAQYLLRHGIKYIDIKEEVQNDQFVGFQKRMRHSTWLSGCKSWYLNEDGTNSTMWPGFSFEYVMAVRKIDWTVYDIVPNYSTESKELKVA